MRKARKLLVFLCTAMLTAGCSKLQPAESTAATFPDRELIAVLDADGLAGLDAYPELEQLDLTGSTCYDAIEAYIAEHPRVKVTYNVLLGDTAVDPAASELTLEPGSFDYETLLRELKHLPVLKHLSLPETDLTLEEYVQLRNSNPALGMEYTVNLGGVICGGDAAEADLSGLTPQELRAAAPALSMLPGLTRAELMREDGTTAFQLEDVAAVQKEAPGVLFHYTFELFGKTISTDDPEVQYANQYIGNKIEGAADTLRMALSIMKGCDRFVLDNCHFENDVLAQIREECRGSTKLVWRIWFGGEGSCLTDREVIRYMPDLTGTNSHNLIYCEDARFIDVGHNSALFNVDFVSKMTKLEAIIISGSPVSDLSPFAGCESLKFLELGYCGYVEDLSPAAQLKNLERINLAYTKVTDLTPLDELPLKVMVDTFAPVSAQERERFDSLHPDCLVQHVSDNPYGYPWRYTLDGVRNDYYDMLYNLFDYSHPAQTKW